MKYQLLTIITLLSIFLTACTLFVDKELCTSPHIEYTTGECCLDQDSNSICDTNESVNTSVSEEGLGVQVKVINLLGDFRRGLIFNSITFEIQNNGKTDIVNPFFSMELLYNYSTTNKQVSQYSFKQKINDTILVGSTFQYKVPISPMEPFNVVINQDGYYDVAVLIKENARQLSNSTEQIVIGESDSWVDVSVPITFEKSEVTKFSSKIKIDKVEVSDDGDFGKTITITIENNNNIKKPVVDVLIRDDHSFVVQDIDADVLITKDINVSFKTHPEDKEYTPFEIYVQLRDGFNPRVYAQTSKVFKLNCERDGEIKEFYDCEAVEIIS